MNQDGTFTAADLPLFIEALVDPAAYAALGYPFTAEAVGDINENGTFDLGDLTRWPPGSAVANTVPEPSTFLLALFALAGVAGRRRF